MAAPPTRISSACTSRSPTRWRVEPGSVRSGGREHTAQVDQERREWREWRFRWGTEDRQRLAEAKDEMRQAGEPDVFLPALFCSPTMELGVDISALNAVYLRNVPPTPANYAQRSGRAGRSGQAALVVTYCAAQGPHDQYYFERPEAMVSGIVRPPALELANRDLVRSPLACRLACGIRQGAGRRHPARPRSDEAGLAGSGGHRARVHRSGSRRRGQRQSMRRILDSIDAELTPAAAPWATDREAFADATARCCRTRLLGGLRSLAAALSGRARAAERGKPQIGDARPERRRAQKAKTQQAQANEQLALLERGTSSGGSDFYTYRYLATEGFLPGYNFPRLPLYAYVPAIGSGPGSKAAYLQRAVSCDRRIRPAQPDLSRGPRLSRLQGQAAARCADREGGGSPPQRSLFATTAVPPTSRMSRNAVTLAARRWAASHPIRNVLRIDNVETQPAERITANDEERQRQGFEIQTVFAWPRRDGALDVTSAVASDADGPILSHRLCLGRDDQPAEQGAAAAQGKEHFRLRHRSRDRPMDRQPRGRRR